MQRHREQNKGAQQTGVWLLPRPALEMLLTMARPEDLMSFQGFLLPSCPFQLDHKGHRGPAQEACWKMMAWTRTQSRWLSCPLKQCLLIPFCSPPSFSPFSFTAITRGSERGVLVKWSSGVDKVSVLPKDEEKRRSAPFVWACFYLPVQPVSQGALGAFEGGTESSVKGNLFSTLRGAKLFGLS